MTRFALPFLAGVVFALGLGISGMTQPAKVIGFLDIAGNWDPSLAFVMAGAVAANLLLLRLGRGLAARLAPGITRPQMAGPGLAGLKSGLREPRLLAGTALFGAGWGLVGFCPGPAIVSAATLQPAVLLFVASMAAGMALYRFAPAIRQALRQGAAVDFSAPTPVEDCGAVTP